MEFVELELRNWSVIQTHFQGPQSIANRENHSSENKSLALKYVEKMKDMSQQTRRKSPKHTLLNITVAIDANYCISLVQELSNCGKILFQYVKQFQHCLADLIGSLQPTISTTTTTTEYPSVMSKTLISSFDDKFIDVADYNR